MKQRIQIVVLLMVFAIVGIISFQIYWVINTYEITEKRFGKDVIDALTEAIESNLISSLDDDFEEQFLADTSFIYSVESALDFPGFMKDSSDFISVQVQNSESLIPNIKRDTFKLSKENSIGVMDKGMSSLIANIINMTMEPEYDIEVIDSLLTIGLKQRDISSEYKLNILKLNEAFDDTSSYEEQGFVISRPFNPFNNKGKVLQIVFPSSVSVIIEKMWLSLLGSLLLIIIVVGSLLLMLSIIYKQKRLSEMKSDFISNMTHEFKTPIATVSAAIEALTSFNALDDKVRTDNYLNLSKKELKRLTAMVEKVLRIAEYEREELELNIEFIELKNLVDNVTDSYLIQKEKSIEVLNHIATEAIISADNFHFRTIIGNLIDNAIKYSDDSVRIELEYEGSESISTITVRDNGIGIAKDKLKYIFDKFYRVTDGNLYKVKGFGLGLSYVKHLVEKHHGNINVSSIPDEGTVFIIELPK